MPEPSIEVRVRDPFRDLTRKERRNLLAISAIAWAIVKTGLVPTQISNLGITLTTKDQSALLKVLAVLVGYFLLAFIIYAVSDWLAFTWAHRLALKAEGDEVIAKLRALDQTREAADKAVLKRAEKMEEYFNVSSANLMRATTPIIAIRWAFELAVPVGAGVYALLALVKAW